MRFQESVYTFSDPLQCPLHKPYLNFHGHRVFSSFSVPTGSFNTVLVPFYVPHLKSKQKCIPPVISCFVLACFVRSHLFISHSCQSRYPSSPSKLFLIRIIFNATSQRLNYSVGFHIWITCFSWITHVTSLSSTCMLMPMLELPVTCVYVGVRFRIVTLDANWNFDGKTLKTWS